MKINILINVIAAVTKKNGVDLEFVIKHGYPRTRDEIICHWREE